MAARHFVPDGMPITADSLTEAMPYAYGVLVGAIRNCQNGFITLDELGATADELQRRLGQE